MNAVNELIKSTYKRFKIIYKNNPVKIKAYVTAAVVIIALTYMLFNTYLKNKEMEKNSMANFGSYAAKKSHGENKTNGKDKKTDYDEVKEGTSEGDSGNGNDTVIVDIGGQVKAPGVYKLKKGSRINDVIQKAGGISEKGDVNKINRAEEISDGEKIYIPAYGEEVNESAGNLVTDYRDVREDKIVVNINKATAVELEKIPGVGPSMAKKIIEHRVSNGKFHSVEDLKNVSGIGDKTFDKMRPYVTI